MTATSIPCIKIACNSCGEEETFVGAQTVDECRDKLYLRGWDFVASMNDKENGQKDYCPDCREKI